MKVLIAHVGNDTALIYRGNFVCSYDHQRDDIECQSMLEQTAQSLANIHNTQVAHKEFEPKDEWNWTEIIADNNLNKAYPDRVIVKVENGIVVSSHTDSLAPDLEIYAMEDSTDSVDENQITKVSMSDGSSADFFVTKVATEVPDFNPEDVYSTEHHLRSDSRTGGDSNPLKVAIIVEDGLPKLALSNSAFVTNNIELCAMSYDCEGVPDNELTPITQHDGSVCDAHVLSIKTEQVCTGDTLLTEVFNFKPH